MYSAGIVTSCVVQLDSTYVHVNHSTLHTPLLQLATADVHSFGHVSLPVVYHVTIASWAAYPHHGNSQLDGAAGSHPVYS